MEKAPKNAATLKGQKREMKRTILTTAVLAMALLTTASNRRTMAYFDNSQIHPADSVAITLSNPQTGSLSELQTKADQLTEEFHQSYPLSPTGRVSIQNINGDVHIAVWDQNEVKVDAVKRAYQRERLEEAKIV